MHHMGFNRVTKVLAAGTALAVLLGGNAFAVDANAVAERIKALYSENGTELAFKNVKSSGSDIILEGSTFKLPSEKGEPTAIGDITLKNVSDGDKGAFKVGEVSVADIDYKPADAAEGGGLSIKGMKMENVIIPDQNASGPLDKMMLYDKSSVDEVKMGSAEKGYVSLKQLEATMDTANKADKIGFTFNVGEFSTDFSKVPENPLKAIDVEDLSGKISSKGAWMPTGGDFTLDEFKISADELGSLNITGALGGFDMAFLEAVKKTQKSMSEAEADQNAAGMAMLGLAEQLNVKNLSIRFDNEELTEKLLTMFASQQGSDAATLSEQVKMMVPLMATQLKNPEFTKQLKEAADKYFSDPKSLTISATPDQAVTFASIAATAGLDPTKIIQLLKVNVQANN